MHTPHYAAFGVFEESGGVLSVVAHKTECVDYIGQEPAWPEAPEAGATGGVQIEEEKKQEIIDSKDDDKPKIIRVDQNINENA